MADSFVISSQWLEGIKNTLGNVTSSGQAAAAIQSGLEFAADAAAAIRAGGSWFSSDPWRDAAVKDIDDAARNLDMVRRAYDGDSTTPLSREEWAKASQKTLYVYSLAQVARKGYPADADTSDLDISLLSAVGSLTQAVLDAPGAIINYTANLANTAIDAAGSVGKHAVKAAGGIVNEAAKQVSDAADNLIPWGTIAGAVLAIGALVGLVVLASRSGALKDVAALKPM
jgi:ElaB/YqjD/DUF883 family membrane-anchored ribosome-binding protein